MLKNWKKWCRLCAKYNEKDDIDIFEHFLDLVQIVEKHFHIMITPADGKPVTICQQCFQFLEKIHKFNEICIKSEKMYEELMKNRTICDLLSIKTRYGIIHPDASEECNCTEDRNHQFTSFKIDQWTDTDDLNNDNIYLNIVKNEITEVLNRKAFPIQKPEGLSTNENFAQVKNEMNEEYHNSTNSVESDHASITNDDFRLTASDTEIKTINKRRIKHSEKLIKCELCDKIFNKRPSYRNHMLSKHGDAKLFCSQCPKFFSSKNSLRSHEKIHLPDNMKLIHFCTYCEKKFSMAANLRAHVKTIHYNERAFVCDECGKGFKTKATLQGHQLSHTEERPFQCPNCPKKFKSLSMLHIHSDHHTDTKYSCSQCDAVFNTKKSLSSHLVVHTDEKKHKCNFCGNEYKRYKALKYHLISHTGFRHSCPFCEKTFADISNCRNHQKAIHPTDYANQLAQKQSKISNEQF